MCLSLPGKIIEINNGIYIVDYITEKRKIETCLIDVKIGDYVIVNNKIIFTKINKRKAEKFLEIIKND